ncbi:hypothetical protein NKDENANG_01342 [Candidatus Entotheonellaceae bacterium PAL068K]
MESDSIGGELVLIGLAILLHGVFDGAEMVLLSVQKSRLQQWRDAGKPGAAAAVRMCEAPERFLMTTQVTTTCMGVVAAGLAGALTVHSLVPRMALWWPLAGKTVWMPHLVLALMVGALTYALFLLGRLVPRAIALQHAERLLCWMAPSLLLLARVCDVLRLLLTASATAVLWLVGQQRPREWVSSAAITEEDVTTMMREGAERGIFEEVEHELIEGVFEFADTAAREVMVPRVRIQALDVATPPQDVLDKLSHIGHSRVPVYDGDLDHIAGVLYFKDLLRTLSEGRPWTLPALLHPPLFVPETVQISQLLRMLQQRRLNMAMVVDEHGGVAGLVTIEDLLEELVGDIADEDEPELDVQVIKLPDGSLVIQGSAPLRELGERYALPVEESPDYQTLAGLILTRLGHVPQGGESIIDQGYKFTVVDVDGPRITRVKVESFGRDEIRNRTVELPFHPME